MGYMVVKNRLILFDSLQVNMPERFARICVGRKIRTEPFFTVVYDILFFKKYKLTKKKIKEEFG